MKNLIQILPNIYGVKVPMEFEYKSDDVYLFGLPSETYKPLGTITATEISFDASEVVESKNLTTVFGEIQLYYNYKAEKFNLNSEQSFRSALPKEIYFENPFGKEEPKPIIHYERHDSVSSSEKIEDWQEVEEYQTAQQNITEKLLILQKL